MQKTERKPLFDLGQLVATPGALAALEKSGQSPWSPSRAMSTGEKEKILVLVHFSASRPEEPDHSKSHASCDASKKVGL